MGGRGRPGRQCRAVHPENLEEGWGRTSPGERRHRSLSGRRNCAEKRFTRLLEGGHLVLSVGNEATEHGAATAHGGTLAVLVGTQARSPGTPSRAAGA